MKKKVCVNIDDKTCNDFKRYALRIGRSVSSLIEEYMREKTKKLKK